jgi:DNA repair protein REV1
MSTAKSLCPQLIVVPYDFHRYQTISEQVYRILASHTSSIQALSCDEAILDVTGIDPPIPPHAEEQDLEPVELIALSIRRKIYEETGCSASAGIGPNILMARLATKKAKPDGQCLILPSQVLSFLSDLQCTSLPGIGYSTSKKLEEIGIKTVRQLQAASKELLIRSLGAKSGTSIWNYAFGRDERRVEAIGSVLKKSIGAEINYGVRCETEESAKRLVDELALQVAERSLSSKGHLTRGRSVTLKLKRRAEGAPEEPRKFLGHGVCDDYSKTHTWAALPPVPALVTGSSERRVKWWAREVSQVACGLLASLQIPPKELRGLGISIGKLSHEENDPALQGALLISSHLSPPSKESHVAGPSRPSRPIANPSTDRVELTASQVDIDVLNELPEEIRMEIEEQMRLEEQRRNPQPSSSSFHAANTAKPSKSKVSKKRKAEPSASFISRPQAPESSSCHLDPKTFDFEMPEELRHELMIDYMMHLGQRGRRDEAASFQSLQPPVDPPPLTAASTERQLHEQEAGDKRRARVAFSKALSNVEEGAEERVSNMVQVALTQLLEDEDLDELGRYLTLLHRARQTIRPPLAETLTHEVEEMQLKIKSRYGFRLFMSAEASYLANNK